VLVQAALLQIARNPLLTPFVIYHIISLKIISRRQQPDGGISEVGELVRGGGGMIIIKKERDREREKDPPGSTSSPL
jgi:hypothetical protein